MKKNYPGIPIAACALTLLTLTFSCNKDHPAATVPVVTTTAINNIKDSTASSGGDVTGSGGSPVMGRGVTWDLAGTFQSTTGSTTDGIGTGNFSSSITGLYPGTTYYVRAYAINSTGTGYGNIIKFTTSYTPSKYTVTTLAGSGANTSADGNGSSASFAQPDGLCVDRSGNVYVADAGSNKIRKITPGGTVSTLASTDGSPFDVAVDTTGNVYVSESTFKILKITPAGVVSTLAGSGVQGAKDSTGAGASFFSPLTLAIDGSGNLFVSDINTVRKITPAGVVTSLPVTGSPVLAVAVDNLNNLYITNGFIVKKIDTLGVMSFLAGGQGNADGFGETAGFNQITELKTDLVGNIYAADVRNNKIRKITPSGAAAVVTTFAGSGITGSADGNAAIATFNGPSGIAIDAAGTVYVADFANNKIRKISL